MKNTLIFTSIYLRTLLKNRRSATVLWLTPIFFLLGAGMIASQIFKSEAIVEPFQVAIVNEDKRVETELVIRQFTESPHLQQMMKTVELEAQEAEVQLRDNQIAAMIHIPKGFSSDVARGINTPVQVIGNGERPFHAQLVRHVMESAADFTSSAQSGINTVDHFMDEAGFSRTERREQFNRDVISFGLHVLGRGELFEKMEQNYLFQQSLLHYYVLSFYVLLIMIWSYMALSLLKANLTKAIQLRLAGLGFLTIQSVFARFLAAYLLVLGSCLLVLIPFSIFQGWATLPLIGVTILLVLVFLSVFVVIESLIKNEKLSFIAGLAVMVFGAIIGEHLIPMVYYPDWLEKLNLFSLNGWMLKWVFSVHQESTAYDASKIGLFLSLFSIGCLMLASVGLLRRKEGR